MLSASSILYIPLKNFPHAFSSSITTIPCILVNSNDWKSGPELRSFWQGCSLPKTTVPLKHIFSSCYFIWLPPFSNLYVAMAQNHRECQKSIWQQTLGTMFTVFFLAACPGLLVEGLHHSRQWWLYTPLQLWQWKLNSPFEGSAGARQHNRTYMGKYMQYQRMSYMYVQCQYELNIHCIQLDSSVVLVLVLKQS